MHTVASLALALLAVQSAYGALFPRHGPVKDLGAQNFKKELGDGHPSMVLFSAPWCGYCKQVAPAWSRAAETLSPLIPFYNIDCDEERNKQFCASEGVKGYPTIKSYPRGSKAAGRIYSGARETKDMVDYATSLVSVDKVQKIKKTQDIDAWLTKASPRPEVPHVLLIHPSSHSVPLMWKVLANRLAGKMVFGFHRDDKGETKKAIGLDMATEKVDQVRVILWNLNGEKEIYEAGPLKFEPLIKYFTHVLGENPVVIEETSSSSPAPTQAKSTAAAKDAETKRREMEAKWQEEERRDRLRREKKERERLARVFEDQDRLAEGEYDDPSPVDDDDDEEDIKVVHVAHGTPEDPVQAEIDAILHELEAVAETAAAEAHDDARKTAHHADDRSAETPLQAASEDFEHGKSDASGEADSGYSATTPLEQEAEEFEHGTHPAVELEDGHARDEL